MKCRVEKRNALRFLGDEICREPGIEAILAAAATPDLREPQLAVASVPALWHLLSYQSPAGTVAALLCPLFYFYSLPCSVCVCVGVGWGILG